MRCDVKRWDSLLFPLIFRFGFSWRACDRTQSFDKAIYGINNLKKRKEIVVLLWPERAASIKYVQREYVCVLVCIDSALLEAVEEKKTGIQHKNRIWWGFKKEWIHSSISQYSQKNNNLFYSSFYNDLNAIITFDS